MEKERLEEAVSIMQARVIGLSSTEPIIRPKPESVDENHPKREEMQNYLGDQ